MHAAWVEFGEGFGPEIGLLLGIAREADAIGFIAAMAVSSTIVDVSPFSTNGALVLANAQGVDRDVFLRQLMIYGGIITLVAPVVVWFLFIVL